jgi:hypothetical protein
MRQTEGLFGSIQTLRGQLDYEKSSQELAKWKEIAEKSQSECQDLRNQVHEHESRMQQEASARSMRKDEGEMCMINNITDL